MDWTLRPSPDAPDVPRPLLLVILDGVGIGRGDEGDAVAVARTPVFDHLRSRFPYRLLKAHGTAVGLPDDGDMGNSEVGHNALGAGRVYDQGAKLVNRAIADGTIWNGETWRRIADQCREQVTPLHLIGLLSDGNVHSHIDHLEALIRRAAEEGLREVFVHPLLDGRDVGATTALDYVDRLEAVLREFDGRDGRRYRVASGGGRMVTTMDRYEADWRIVERGWNAHVHGRGRGFRSAREAIETFRSEEPGIVDQFLPPFVIVEESGRPTGPIRDGAGVVFFNFRGDRGIEISRAFEQDDFRPFDRGERPRVIYAGMMQYDGDYEIPRRFLVSPPAITGTLGEYLARNQITQFACSETQKFGHVTYFWNGNRGGKFDESTETYLEVPSDLVPFEQRPWMKAAEITDATIEALRSSRDRFLRINFANGDMVGHTGDFEAAVLAVESVDLCLGRLVEVAEETGALLVVTADHGNADEMYEREASGAPRRDGKTGRLVSRPSHSLNPVPFLICDVREPERWRLRADLPHAGLTHVAATLLRLLGREAPEGYDASLLA